MALGSAWWIAKGLASRWVDDFASSAFTLSSGVAYAQLYWDECTQYQEPFARSGGSGNDIPNDGKNAGYYYLENSSGVVVRYPVTFSNQGGPNDSSNVPQWVELEPKCVEGILDFVSAISTVWSAMYKTGFCLPVVGTSYNPEFRVWFLGPGSTGTFTMFHYAPWAWFGTPPEVAAAIAMQAGLTYLTIDAATYWFINTESFDLAHEQYDYSTGSAPWTDLDSTWTIYARRQYGKSVSSMLLEVAKHGRDYLYCDERGRLATSSFTAPNETLAGLDHGDGVVGMVHWEDTADYIINHIIATWGYCIHTERLSYTEPEQGSGYIARPDPLLGGYDGDKWTHETSLSATLYGKRYLPGRKFVQNVGGISREVTKAHYPYLLSPHDATYPAAGGMVHVTNWLTSDSKPRKVITVVQDLRGLDYAIGDQVTDVELTSDGATVADTRCIEKNYDFSKMTVTSTLLEIPSNS